MRRLAIVGSLALMLAIAAPTSAASVTSYQATLAKAGISGTITVSISGQTGTLTEKLSGLTPGVRSTLWLRGGSCSSTGFGIVRVHATPSRTGRASVTVTLKPEWVGYFKLDWSRRGGVHATLTDGPKVVCARMTKLP